jgi:metal-dependent hydrolase (beta-lactamase superfamily II)
MTRAIVEVEILNLVDGNVKEGRVIGEAGYSALVKVTYDDSSKFTFLFDTSISALALAHNMTKLDKDLTTVKMIVLSHGHLDHVGPRR